MTNTRPKTRSRLKWIVIGLVALGLAAWAANAVFGREDTPQYMSAAVSRGDIEENVLATGTIRPTNLVAVGAQVSGRVTKLAVELGQMVKQGDLIAEIDPVTRRNDLSTAEAQLAAAKAQRDEKLANLKYAEATLERQRITLQRRTSSQADFDAAEESVAVLQAQIAALGAQITQAELAVETAQINLGYTSITAPTNGTVLSIVTRQGQTLNAVQSAPTIVILGQLDMMEVKVEIAEADIVRVQPGQPLYFTVIGDNTKRFDAQLDAIEPAPESIRSDSAVATSTTASSTSSASTSAVYYNGVFQVPNPDNHLKTYMTAEVHIVLGKAKNALLIPSASLGPRVPDGRYTVQVIDDENKLTQRMVEIGLNNRVMAEVKAGLEEGERVVSGRPLGQGASAARQRGPRGPMGM
ncbi:efflux RND transporter periplasmic adaptor subunit [Limoniibacter endophyticus]|uniref:Hemolysin secretion protein D n=1 Tax=Limoniibacter endophyticus TaxID=1565040 RepID=A0A8J3DUC0_9HYPH|nr:efflux RND transporter periplasmic adaptor subunit [Limoniibacter endophyticus]GHC77689.1 hemolysin secretion protein D [Limoniibacter endophyticus]